MELSKSDITRFWAKVDTSGSCWMWTAAANSAGYGQIGIGGRAGRNYYAHRVSFTLANGPIPDGFQIDHICMTCRCVNPAHLRLATNKQNNEHKRGAQRNSKSGVRGVYRHGRGWSAEVQHRGRHYYGGTHDTVAEAADAAKQLRNQLFTHNDKDRA